MATDLHDPNDAPLSSTAPPEPGMQHYFTVLLKRKIIILPVFVVVMAAAMAWTFTRTRVYRAATTVIIDRRAPQVLGKDVGEVIDLSTGTYWSNKEYMKTQETVITSKSLALEVARELNLAADPIYWTRPSFFKRPEVAEREARTTLRMAQAPERSTSGGTESVGSGASASSASDGKTGSRAASKPSHTLEEAAGRLQGLIRASTVRDSNILEIAVEHPMPAMAAKLANAVADQYLAENLNYKSRSTEKAADWLYKQLDDLKKKLESVEIKLFQFKKEKNIVSISLEDRQNLITRQIERISEALTDIRLRRMALEARRKQMIKVRKQDPLGMSLAPVLENTTIQALKDSYIREHREYQALTPKYGERFPLVMEQKAKADAAWRDLEREVSNLLASVDTQFEEIKDTEAKLAAALQAAKDEALDVNKSEIEYRRLMRDQENTAKLYSLVLSRWKESNLSSRLPFTNIRPLDRAMEPHVYVRPRVGLNLVIGAILGILLGIGLALLVENLDRSVKTQEEIEQVPGLTYLGMLPKIPGSMPDRRGKHRPAPDPDVDLIVHRKPESRVAEQCRSIRTNLLFASPDRPMRKLLISSAEQREGKTTAAASLAITMAQAGSRVLLVDTDMRRPRLHRIFGVPHTQGITSILAGSATIDEAIKRTEVENLWVLPSGARPPKPAELCQSESFTKLMNELSNRFDRIIMDSPPILPVTDAVVLSTNVDGALIVARSGKTSRLALAEATRLLQGVGANVLGCVLNDFDLEKRRYGYNSYYYKYGRYGQGPSSETLSEAEEEGVGS